MKRFLSLTLFALATLSWMSAQQPSQLPQGNPQSAPPSAQMPDASQQPPQAQTPGSAGAAQGTTPGMPAANAEITEGCLGGTNPNYTITDASGKSYKINIPQGADASVLAPHVGESIAVMGHVNKGASAGQSSIDATKVGRGTTKCSGSSTTATQPPPKK